MNMNRPEQLLRIQCEGYELFTKKNRDYGDSFATYGPIGVIVRMGDKISRLTSLTKNGIQLIDNESVRDTLIDLHNYSAMAVMLMDEEKEKRQKLSEEVQRISLLTGEPKKDVIVNQEIIDNIKNKPDEILPPRIQDIPCNEMLYFRQRNSRFSRYTNPNFNKV